MYFTGEGSLWFEGLSCPNDLLTAREDNIRGNDEMSSSRALFLVSGLSGSDSSGCLAAKVAANGDALGIDRHIELSAESSTALVGQRSNKLAAGRDKDL